MRKNREVAAAGGADEYCSFGTKTFSDFDTFAKFGSHVFVSEKMDRN